MLMLCAIASIHGEYGDDGFKKQKFLLEKRQEGNKKNDCYHW